MLSHKTTTMQFYEHSGQQLREIVLTKALPWGVLLISVTAVIATSILTGKVTESPAIVAFILLPYTASMMLRTNAEYVTFIVILLASILILYHVETMAGDFTGLSTGAVLLHSFAIVSVAAVAYIAQMHYRRLSKLQMLHDDQVQASIKAMAMQERLAALGRISAAISHQINNPIQVITFALDNYLSENKDDPNELVQIARQNLDLLIEIMGSLNSFVRPERTDTPSTTDMADATKKALSMFQSRILAEHVSVELALDGFYPQVSIPSSDLIQVISVLIANAVDATKGKRNPALRINMETRGTNVCLTVTDNGAGISEDNRDRIFEPFFTTKDDGVGLGLFIVYNIVSRHGGTIEYSPATNGGTTFVVRLPIAR